MTLTTRLRRASALRALGLPVGAVDPAQVQQRWRQLAMQTHPDRGVDARAFQRVQGAWQTLSAVSGRKERR